MRRRMVFNISDEEGEMDPLGAMRLDLDIDRVTQTITQQSWDQLVRLISRRMLPVGWVCGHKHYGTHPSHHASVLPKPAGLERTPDASD